MNRRDFLLLKVSPTTKAVVLSCEELYMRFIDSKLDGSTDRLLGNLADDLTRTNDVRLIETSWLSDDSLKQALDPLLDSFRQRGGHVLGR